MNLTNSVNDLATIASNKKKSIVRKFIAASKHRTVNNKIDIVEAIKQGQRQERQKRIAALEQLFLEVKVKAEEPDLAALAQSVHTVNARNQVLHEDYLALEDEVG